MKTNPDRCKRSRKEVDYEDYTAEDSTMVKCPECKRVMKPTMIIRQLGGKVKSGHFEQIHYFPTHKKSEK